MTAIFHDDRFTYIQANPEETPALYEMKDGKPNLINFQFKAEPTLSTRFWTAAISRSASSGCRFRGWSR